MGQSDLRLLTVDVVRRGYGKRYTGLPVDELRRDGFAIHFAGSYLRPEQIDVRVGDTVRWLDGGRRLQGRVSEVRREELWLHASVEDVVLLPPDAFFES